MATIAQLEETARQDGLSATHYDSLAGKIPERYDEYKALADLCRYNRETALLAIKAQIEAAQYTQFDHRREPDEQ